MLLNSSTQLEKQVIAKLRTAEERLTLDLVSAVIWPLANPLIPFFYISLAQRHSTPFCSETQPFIRFVKLTFKSWALTPTQYLTYSCYISVTPTQYLTYSCYISVILGQADVTAGNQRQRKERPAFPLHLQSFVTRLPSSAFWATTTNHHLNKPFLQFRHRRHCHMTGPRNRYWLEAFLFSTHPTFHSVLGKETNPSRQPKEFHPWIPALKLTSVVLFSGVRILLSPSKNFLSQRRCHFSRNHSFRHHVTRWCHHPRRLLVCTRMRTRSCHTIFPVIHFGGKFRREAFRLFRQTNPTHFL